MSNVIEDKVLLAEGFVYWEQVTSPDGSIYVVNGYRDGERSPTLIEPRFIRVSDGKTLLDLWRTYLNYETHFQENGTIRLTIHNPYRNTTREVEIDFGTGTFAFPDSPQQREPIAKFHDRIMSANNG